MLAHFLEDIPDIGSIERGDYFQESTVIYDKKWNPIYTLYSDGKRTYIPYSDISDSIKNALISTEDKTFFENPGIDIKGLGRAGLNYALGKTERIKGTSTLSQQLISYTLLSKERSLKRKVREAYLSYQLNKNYSKEKILEMYLNTISFWHNANGVEEASKTYFGKSAKEVWPLGATVLASLPKGPTYYSPYAHRDRLMGGVVVYPLDDPSAQISLDTPESRKEYAHMYTAFKSYLSGITLETSNNEVRICHVKDEYNKNPQFAPSKDGCIDTSFDNILPFFGNIIIKEDKTESGSTLTYALEYIIGRKDFVAQRMLEDDKIDGNTFIKIIYDGLEFEFRKYTENIKFPYFVMYVKEYLETKYGKDMDITQGLKVYTTLDPDLQQKAEDLVRKQVAINKTQYKAKSAALVSMDNSNGALLAMVGWPDYFDTENGGNNNMAIADTLQPGSSFKPIVYALAISKQPIGPATPVSDVKLKIWNWEVNNYDRGFKWLMTLETALNYSRNIPAVKMYFLAGREEQITPFWQKIGVKTLIKDYGYGASMALGTANVRPIDLMQAYSVFANLGIKRDVHAIEKITGPGGIIIEEQQKPEKEDPIFSPAASYILNKILTNIEARPDGKWRDYITVSGGRPVAVKTGTSNKDLSIGGVKKILPRDLWTAGYSPQITTVVWVGNVDGKETNGSCDGLNCAAPIWKAYMEYALSKLPKKDWEKPDGIYTYTIVKSSGKLATEKTPPDQKISTIMAVKLTDSDDGFQSVEVDGLCNGALSENTPIESIKKIFIPIGGGIIDGFDPSWKKGYSQEAFVWPPCERPGGVGNISISLNTVGATANNTTPRKTVEGSWSWDRWVKVWRIIVDGIIKTTQTIDGDPKLSGDGRTSIDVDGANHTITFEVIDLYGFSYRESRILSGDGKISNEIHETSPTLSGTIDNTHSGTVPSPSSSLQPQIAPPPEITVTNPRNGHISLYRWSSFNLRYTVNTAPGMREITTTVAWKTIQSATSGESFVVPVSTDTLEPGEYQITITVVDAQIRSSTKNLALSVMPPQ